MAADWKTEVCGLESAPEPDPAPGLDALRALVATVVEGEDKDAAVEAIAKLLEDEGAMAAIVLARRVEGAAVEALLTRIGGKRGFGVHVGRLRKTLDERVKEQKAEERQAALRLVEPDEEAPPLDVTLDGWVGVDNLPPGLRTPPGWAVTPGGVFHLCVDRSSGELVRTRVSAQVILVTGRLKDVHDGTTSHRVEWGRDARVGHRVVHRGQVMDSRQIVALADHDAPVSSTNAREIVSYLSDFESHNLDVIPEAKVSGVMGWQAEGEDLSFLWGRQRIAKGCSLAQEAALEDVPPRDWSTGQLHLLVDDGGAEMADGFRAAGTWEGWMQAVTEATPYPAVFLALYAALVPPLMEFVTVLPNFIVDFSGSTSSGKTTVLRLAASVWGCPDERQGGLVRSWDATRVWIERTSGILHALPMFLDDTKRARWPRQVAQVLYDVANGIGRGRGSVGGTRRTARWRLVLISTGETPATSFTQDGGTRTRTLSLWGSPFGGADETTAKAVAAINIGVLEHHGHAGPRMISWLLEQPGAQQQVRERYKEALAHWSALAGGNAAAGRAAQYMAALSVARGVLHEVLGAPLPVTDPLAIAWEAVLDASVEADRATEALDDALSWATSHQARFYGRLPGEAPRQMDPMGGWLGAWPSNDHWRHIAFLNVELKNFLGRQGYDIEAVLRTWDDRGWLLKNKGGRHRTKKLTVGIRKERCVVVSRHACDAVAGEHDDE